MNSSNPALKRIHSLDNREAAGHGGEVMTIQGTINKIGLLLACALATAVYTWQMDPAQVQPWMYGGLIGGLVFALVTIFKSDWAGVTAPLYALFEGLFLGAITHLANMAVPGIALQAIGLTFGIFFAMVFAYKSGIIRATAGFKRGVIAATGGIFLFYMVSFVLRLFGISIPFIHETGLIGIGISAAIVVIASLNLILDFDVIEKGAEMKAPVQMEWYAAFGLMVTLVWLYIEVLRLLMILASFFDD